MCFAHLKRNLNFRRLLTRVERRERRVPARRRRAEFAKTRPLPRPGPADRTVVCRVSMRSVEECLPGHKAGRKIEDHHRDPHRASQNHANGEFFNGILDYCTKKGDLLVTLFLAARPSFGMPSISACSS